MSQCIGEARRQTSATYARSIRRSFDPPQRRTMPMICPANLILLAVLLAAGVATAGLAAWGGKTISVWDALLQLAATRMLMDPALTFPSGRDSNVLEAGSIVYW